MKASTRLVALIGAIFFFSEAASASFICKANPRAYLAIGGDGLICTAIDNGREEAIVAIRSVSVTDGSTTAQACTEWYSLLLTLRSTGGKALPHFDSAEPSNDGATACSSFGSWQHHVSYCLLAE